MSKNRKKAVKKKANKQTILPLRHYVKANLYDSVITLGLKQIYEILEEERTALCGPRYRHEEGRAAVRSGHVRGELPMGGRTIVLDRPRVRTADGRKEIPLESWGEFREADSLSKRTMEQMIIGVSTRKYQRSLEPLPAEIEYSGTSKSAVSRRVVQGTQKKLDELISRDLSALQFIAIIIDGVHFADHVVLVALGIDENGHKIVLGLHEGATENSSACKELLNGIVDRGVSTSQSILFVIDGGKGLKKAITEIWGKQALIQRCRIHKLRNVKEHLPFSMQVSVSQAMWQAYSLRDVAKAKKLLLNLAAKLENKHPGAASSLREGLDDTLTIMGLNLPELLEKSLSVTNAIENIFSSVRRISGRVKRWNGGKMILRWSAASLLEAEKGFQRIRGYKQIPKLIEALKTHVEKQRLAS